MNLVMLEPVNQGLIVSGDNNRRAHPVQFFEQIEQPDRNDIVDISRRFVREQQARSHRSAGAFWTAPDAESL